MTAAELLAELIRDWSVKVTTTCVVLEPHRPGGNREAWVYRHNGTANGINQAILRAYTGEPPDS
jgi:hypothetical protein